VSRASTKADLDFNILDIIAKEKQKYKGLYSISYRMGPISYSIINIKFLQNNSMHTNRRGVGNFSYK